MSILFAATYPERVAGLILFGTYARTVGSSVPFDDFAGLERDIRSNWGYRQKSAKFLPLGSRNSRGHGALRQVRALGGQPVRCD